MPLFLTGLNINQTPPSALPQSLQLIWWLAQLVKDLFATLDGIKISGIPFTAVVVAFVMLSLILTTLYIRKG